MPYDLPNGQYPFPLNFLASEGGVNPVPFVAGNPFVEPDSENWFVLCLTPDEMLDLISVIDVGAPIAFPDTYNVITQKYMQMREFPNQIPEGSCMDLCTLILNCIDSTPELQQAIAQYSLGSSIPIDGEVDTIIAGTNVLRDAVGCDDDNLFGMTTGITDLYNNLALDILEQLVASVNTIGQMGDIIEAIPVLGLAPVDDILQFIEAFVDNLLQNYESEYTVALRDDIRCDLFCLARANCNLTFEEIFDYYNSKLIESIELTDVIALILYMNVTTFTGDKIVYAWNAFVAGIFMFAGDVIGIDSAQLITMVSAMFNDPDSDWSTVCDECEWEQLLVSNSNFNNIEIIEWGGGAATKCFGEIVGNEIHGCNNELEFGNLALGLEMDVPDTTTITGMVIKYKWKTTRSPYFVESKVYDSPPYLLRSTHTVNDVQEGTTTHNATGLTSNDGVIQVLFSSRAVPNSEDDSWYLICTEITVTGTGINPFL